MNNFQPGLRSKSGPGMNDTFIHFSVWIFVVVETAKEIEILDTAKLGSIGISFESAFFKI